MVGRWFDHYRGRAFAVMGVINSLCFNAAPAILSFLVGHYSWQVTWQILAVVAGGFFLVFSWIFFRDNPEGRTRKAYRFIEGK